ncbi:MAG: hypothetical protein A3K65_07890 [Euryarchaeota archaeon RBG_16_68_12]|nr:MAG: hypothetical protein A3K65_07890 [Euryarchaeota archaeon RBG_16_68_12]
MGLGVVGVVLALLAIVGPWWTLSMSVSIPGETMSGSANYGLLGWTLTLTEPGTGTLTNSGGSRPPRARAPSS